MRDHGASEGRIADGPAARQFVDPEEFILQIMSRRQLMRCDDSGDDVRGLLDPATGRRIFIETDRLLTSR